MTSTMYVLALTVTLIVLTNGADYCKLKSCNPASHTVCKYGYLRVSSNCGKVKSSTLTKSEIKELLDIHNVRREYVASGQEKRGSPGPQPAAKNVQPLKWDQELAAVAQSWADQCQYGHDKCRNVERFIVGQNIAWESTTGADNIKLASLVDLWYNEVKDFDRNQISAVTQFNGVGHYTQMLWANTELVGCGAVRYNNDGQWNSVYLVCNYGPAGNIVGAALYKTA